MKRFSLCLVAAALAVSLAAPSAFAAQGRVDSLLNNMAFEDQTDAYMFPQLLPKYRGVYFHMPATGVQDVHGGVIFGDKARAYGLFIRRPDANVFNANRINALGADPVAQLGFMADAAKLDGQVFDLLYGGGGFGLGVRLHGWSDVSQNQGVLGAPGGEFGNKGMGIDINAGFQLMRGLHARVNLGILWSSEQYTTVRFNAGARYIQPGDRPMKLVAGGELQIAYLSPENGDGSWGFAIPIKAGYQVNVMEQLQLGILVGLDIQAYKDGFNDADTRFGLGLPTAEIAAEWTATDWMQVRSAIKGGYGVTLAGDPNDDMPKYEHMTFSSGVGFNLGMFHLDTVIQYAFWNNGPNFISGQQGNLFGGVTLSYNWGQQ